MSICSSNDLEKNTVVQKKMKCMHEDKNNSMKQHEGE